MRGRPPIGKRAMTSAERSRRMKEKLRAALEESVRLQSHYAGLLNRCDGGERLQFGSASEWIEQLKRLK